MISGMPTRSRRGPLAPADRAAGLSVSVGAEGRRLAMRVHGALDGRTSHQLAEIVEAAVQVTGRPELVEVDVRPIGACGPEGAGALAAWERRGIRVRRLASDVTRG
jgi:hypothetical protein